MKLGSVLGVVLAFGLALATLLRAAPGAAPAKAPAPLIQARVEAARRTYEAVWKNNREGLVAVAELVYRWSRRWLEAELEPSDNKDTQVAACTAHRDRMRELARITRDRFRNRVTTVEEASAAGFYVAEAEIWIEQAKSK